MSDKDMMALHYKEMDKTKLHPHVQAPEGSMGNPNKVKGESRPWAQTVDIPGFGAKVVYKDWNTSIVDKGMIEFLARKYPNLVKHIAKFWPADGSFKAVDDRLFDEQTVPMDSYPTGHALHGHAKHKMFPPGSCNRCRFRPVKPTSGTVDKPDWWYGDGIGAHSAVKCCGTKMDIAQGGDINDNSQEAVDAMPFIQRCLACSFSTAKTGQQYRDEHNKGG